MILPCQKMIFKQILNDRTFKWKFFFLEKLDRKNIKLINPMHLVAC